MQKKSSGTVLIVNALIWAAAILGLSYIFRDAEWAGQIAPWLIVGFLAVNGLLLSRAGRKKRCGACE